MEQEPGDLALTGRQAVRLQQDRGQVGPVRRLEHDRGAAASCPCGTCLVRWVGDPDAPDHEPGSVARAGASHGGGPVRPARGQGAGPLGDLVQDDGALEGGVVGCAQQPGHLGADRLDRAVVGDHDESPVLVQVRASGVVVQVAPADPLCHGGGQGGEELHLLGVEHGLARPARQARVAPGDAAPREHGPQLVAVAVRPVDAGPPGAAPEVAAGARAERRRRDAVTRHLPELVDVVLPELQGDQLQVQVAVDVLGVDPVHQHGVRVDHDPAGGGIGDRAAHDRGDVLQELQRILRHGARLLDPLEDPGALTAAGQHDR
ncbi:hypothetical protein GCM10011509_04470 [Ornithinimicrobium pekingense]|uniref:Uncharacterized protein n=1 Tax=Ornithinimicrobium pekingense TaxID=384677 RepID=A0ABQ2F714_9MICO|nr:hypothetical protein GCM10011509_04470 [Ornithinimicrobium pekingense]